MSEERINEQQDSSGETVRNGTQRARALENTNGKLKDVEDRVKRSHIGLMRVSGEETEIWATIWNLNFVLKAITSH